MFLSNVLIQASIKFLVTQIEIKRITFECSSRGQPPWKYVAPAYFSLRWSYAYNPYIRSYLFDEHEDSENCLIKSRPSCKPSSIMFIHWKNILSLVSIIHERPKWWNTTDLIKTGKIYFSVKNPCLTSNISDNEKICCNKCTWYELLTVHHHQIQLVI